MPARGRLRDMARGRSAAEMPLAAERRQVFELANEHSSDRTDKRTSNRCVSADRPVRSHASSGMFGGVRVLVVEDDDRVAGALCDLLGRHGFVISRASGVTRRSPNSTIRSTSSCST